MWGSMLVARRSSTMVKIMTEETADDAIPDVRDGLTRKERIILDCLYKIQTERGGRNVPTSMLYGRVVEYVDFGVDEMQAILQRLTKNQPGR